MAIENRQGRFYYYRKRREGGRVVSEYCGACETAIVTAAADRLEREARIIDKENARRSMEAEDKRQAAIEETIDEVHKQAESVADAMFLINGFIKHSRQWRRKGREREIEKPIS